MNTGQAASNRVITRHRAYAAESVSLHPVPDPAPLRPAPVLAPVPESSATDSGAIRRTGYPGKRLLDLAGSAVALVLLAPVMAAVAAAVALTSRGPVVFRQERVGVDGRPFVFYKFRTMFHGADDGVHRDFVTRLIRGEPPGSPAEDGHGEGFKLQEDPRITPLGRFLRRTSLDELPQFLNVLRGDMSLVGPRPPLPYEAAEYSAWQRRRLAGKPGITGPWQVDGRSRVPFDEMVRMDLDYLEHASPGRDLRLLARTVFVVLRGDGAR